MLNCSTGFSEESLNLYFPKAWRRVFSRGGFRLDYMSSLYMDGRMDGVMDDAWMDGVMDFVGFRLEIHNVLSCFKARGRVGGSRRTWLNMVRARQPLLELRS